MNSSKIFCPSPRYFTSTRDRKEIKKKKKDRESSTIDLNMFRSLPVSNHTPVVHFSLLTKKRTQQKKHWGILP